MKMEGNWVEVRKLNGEIKRKNQERQGILCKGKMKGTGRAQWKRKNKRITSTDKRNNWKTKNKYRFAKK